MWRSGSRNNKTEIFQKNKLCYFTLLCQISFTSPSVENFCVVSACIRIKKKTLNFPQKSPAITKMDVTFISEVAVQFLILTAHWLTLIILTVADIWLLFSEMRCFGFQQKTKGQPLINGCFFLSLFDSWSYHMHLCSAHCLCPVLWCSYCLSIENCFREKLCNLLETQQ